MASLLLKGVHKRLGLPSISCSSADATSVVSSTTTGTSRFIDRHSPRLRDPHRSSTSRPPRPSSSNADTTTKDSSSASSSPKPDSNQQQHGHGTKKKKSTTDGGRKSSSSEKRLVSPVTSSRFLLNSSRMQSDDLGADILALPPPPPPSFIDMFPGKDAPLPAGPAHFPDEGKPSVMQVAESSSSGSSASSSSSSEITAAPVGDREQQEEVIKRSSSTRGAQAAQVVVLRVSLHCKGCAGKVKKHIAKMEGVTSFDIDIATKKVTVVGDVTPLGVLNSVSKVKPAQFWPSTPPPRTTYPPRASASF